MVTHRDYVMIEFDKFVDAYRPSGILIDVGCYDNKLKQTMTDKGFKWIGVDKFKADAIKSC
jgi:hypothetical protein